MPRFAVCLTASLRRVYADEALTSDINKRIELKDLFVSSCGLIQLFLPREYIPFSRPMPMTLLIGVECNGTIKVYPGFVQIVRIVQCLSLLGESQSDESEIGLSSHSQWIDVAIVEGGGVGAELDLVPQIRGVESGLEHRAYPLV